MKEIRIAAWLHDIGKITTPEYVVDKATKLETIFDRIHTIKLRNELLKRDAEIEYWRELATLDRHSSNYGEKEAALRETLQATLKRCDDDMAFLEKVNLGGEFMSPQLKENVFRIASSVYMLQNEPQPFLSDEEIMNLNISRGTLNDKERKIIENHVVMTIKMLSQLPFPKKLARVAEYAGGHHERLDGTGYPNGATESELSLPARIMALADIFEALTAADRPYKKGKTLSEAIKILGFMAKDRHIDPDLLKTFLEDKLHLQYAQKYINPAQIDINETE
jgi:response regulator RpfG family c-di-GMP phosphodiesterase